MGRLFLIHDYSPARPWLYALLNANRRRIAGQGLVFAPFNQFSREWQVTHEHFFRKYTDKVRPNENILGLWRVLRDRAARDDVLLFTHSPFSAPHEGFWESLKEYAGIDPADARQLFIIAPPSVVIEHRYREFPNLAPDVGAELTRAYGSLFALTEAAEKRLGDSNVKIIANLNNSAISLPAPDIGSSVFEFLGREGDLAAADNFLFPTRYKSATARALSRAGGVGWNIWKPLNYGAYAETLSRAEESWDEDFASPLAARRKLNSKEFPQIALLEKKLGLPNGALNPAPALIAKEALPAPGTLDPARSSAFVDMLPENVKSQLRARYLADEELLSADQLALLKDLGGKGDDAPEFSVVGDAEPPIELTVLTMTYNQEKYIAECMDSVLKQKTDFPVTHLVLDHSSTDGTPAIIREYASKYPSVRPVLLSRRVPEENVRGLFARCRVKYAALCDGDDYFSSPDKLQKQVDYLEARPHCSMCFHRVAVVFEDGSKPFRFPPLDMLPLNKKMEFRLAQLTKNNFIQTNSAVYRWRFRDGLPSWFRADICPGDWYWHLLHAEIGNIGFLPDVMAVYRRHKGALFNAAQKDPEAHWRARGLSELKTYQVCDDHFQNRYFRNFSALAANVFSAFKRIAAKDGDASLLDKAGELYPKFALDFFLSHDKLTGSPGDDKAS